MAPLSYSAPVATRSRGLSVAAAPGCPQMTRTPTFSALSTPHATKIATPSPGFRTPRQPRQPVAAAALPNLMGAGRASNFLRRASFSSDSTASPVGDGRPKVVCYGDSLTAGFTRGGTQFVPYGTALRQGLAASGVQCDVVINGLTGHTAKQMLRELDAPMAVDQCGKPGRGLRCLISEEQPELVVIMAGTNDLGMHWDVAETFASICQLHAACHAQGVPTFAVSPPHYAKRPECARLSQMLRAWSQQEPMVKAFMDIEELVPSSAMQLWDADKLHFSVAGCQELGRKLSRPISKMLERPESSSDEETTSSPPRKFFAANSTSSAPRKLFAAVRGGA